MVDGHALVIIKQLIDFEVEFTVDAYCLDGFVISSFTILYRNINFFFVHIVVLNSKKVMDPQLIEENDKNEKQNISSSSHDEEGESDAGRLQLVLKVRKKKKRMTKKEK